MKYLIVKKTNDPKDAVVSRNSRELKRRIKSSKSEYKRYTAGEYQFVNKDAKVCFIIRYDIITNESGKIRIKGKEVSL